LRRAIRNTVRNGSASPPGSRRTACPGALYSGAFFS
jgi:hypothetical protein